MWRRVRRAARLVFGRTKLQDGLTDEVQFHLDARAADLERRGFSASEARRIARLEFGSAEAHKDAAREAAGLRLLSDFKADAIYAFRLGRRQPAFTLVALLSLGLGVGVNTLVFSVTNALVLRPLPVERPRDLVFVSPPGGASISFPIYQDVRDRTSTLSGLIGYRVAPMNFDHDGAAVRVWGYLATGNYFDVLGVQPAAGSFFHQRDDRPPAPSPLAVVSYDCWMTRLGGTANAIGSAIRLNGQPYTVIGVAPRGFVGTEVFYRPDVWVPMTMQPQIEARTSWLTSRQTHNTWAIGRLKPGISPAQANADLTAIATDLSRTYPASDDGLRLAVSEPGLVGDVLRAPVKAFTLAVLALAGLVLLMACVNLAMVLVARGADRQRELAIRLSIGAGAGRLLRQLLTETLLLAAAGGALGLGLALLASRALSAWRLPVEFPIQFDVAADLPVFLFALGVSTMAGVLFGLAPARLAARTDANAVLKGSRTHATGRRRWGLPDALVIVQVTLCVVLLAGCLLALRGLGQALTMPIGMRVEGVTLAGYDVGLAGYDRPRGAEFEQQALEAVRRLPGVESAAYSDTLPLNIDQSHQSIVPDDRPDLRPSQTPQASRYRVSPGFLRTLGIRLLLGRDFTDADAAGAPHVAVINQTLAREVLRTDAAVGRRIRFGWSGDWTEVVGVVEDGKYESLGERPKPAVFVPASQWYTSTVVLTVRSSLPPAQMVTAMRQTLAQLDSRLALYETESLSQMLAFVLLPNRVAAVALGAFGALALILAVTGLHGVVTQAVVRRRKEIGIRTAIGARPGEIVRLVLGRTAALLGVGAIAGGVIVLAGGSLLASVIFQTSPRDPLVLIAVSLGLMLTGAVACWMPVRRVLRVNPTITLRTE